MAGATGVYSALRSRLSALKLDDMLASTDQAIKTGYVKNYADLIDVRAIVNESVQPLRNAIVSRAQALIGPHSRRLNGVIVTGGIAPLVFGAIKAALPNAVLDVNPSMAIAEGLCRFGLFAHYAWADKYRVQP